MIITELLEKSIDNPAPAVDRLDLEKRLTFQSVLKL